MRVRQRVVCNFRVIVCTYAALPPALHISYALIFFVYIMILKRRKVIVVVLISIKHAIYLLYLSKETPFVKKKAKTCDPMIACVINTMHTMMKFSSS